MAGAPPPSMLMQFINSPTGPRTTHFWGPVANWGLVAAAIADMSKPADTISLQMTAVLCAYSGLFMRFAWMVAPRNYLMLATHVCNEAVQSYQLSRAVAAQGLPWAPKEPAPAAQLK